MTGMEVLIVGSGGREHALALRLSESDSVNHVHSCPGNAGTAISGTNYKVDSMDIEGIIKSYKFVVPLLSGLGRSTKCGVPH